MHTRSIIASLLLSGLLAPLAWAQLSDPAVGGAPIPQAQPPARAGRGATPAVPHITPTPEQLTAIQTKLNQLNAALKELKDAKIDDALIAEAEVSAHYVGLTLRFQNEEFFDAQVTPRCLSVLDSGLQRAAEIKAGKPSWIDAKGRVQRAFRSRIDGTPQPYRVMIPASYDKTKPIPLYIYLHGRGDTDQGLGWIGGQTRAANGEAAGTGAAFIQLQVFGRANNSFRFAGEDDVLQAIDTVRKNYNIDPDRIVLAGFSMGGAGSWQIGLHSPDLFCGLEIDAGVIGNRRAMDGLTPPQKAANALYGIMIDHAINTLTTPLVGYAGANDAQLQASTAMREQLIKEGFTIDHPSELIWRGSDIRNLFLAMAGQGHSHATGENLRLINDFTAQNFKTGRVTPDRIRFVTYTTRYNKDYWLTIDGMRQQFDRAFIDATRDPAKTTYTVKTTNISRLLLTDTSAAQKITIDGDTLSLKPAPSLLLAQSAGHWKLADASADTGLRKQHNLQGPINDAFLDAFLCVTPTGASANALLEERNKQELAHFDLMMAKEYRGAAPVKPDSALTPDDIAKNNLILFGDPDSNKILAQIADKLPIKWNKQTLTVGTKTYDTTQYLPVLIFPNPLNPTRYVVINTGLVAGGGVSNGYGDYAVLKMTKQPTGAVSTEIADNGVFDESWKLPTPQ